MKRVDETLADLMAETERNLRLVRGKAEEREGRLERLTRADEGKQLRSQLPSCFDRMERADLLRDLPPSFQAQAEHWVPASGNLLLTGPTGLGKTRAAVAIARRLIKRGVMEGGPSWRLVRSLTWLWVPALERARREHPLGQGEAPAVWGAKQASLLVLDDFGQGTHHEACRDVLDERYRAGRPTIATSGFSSDELGDRCSAMVVRRLLECGDKGGLIVDGFGGGV